MIGCEVHQVQTLALFKQSGVKSEKAQPDLPNGFLVGWTAAVCPDNFIPDFLSR